MVGQSSYAHNSSQTSYVGCPNSTMKYWMYLSFGNSGVATVDWQGPCSPYSICCVLTQNTLIKQSTILQYKQSDHLSLAEHYQQGKFDVSYGKYYSS